MTAKKSPYPLPISLENLTHDWLEAALLSQNPGISLRNSEIIDVAHGTCTRVRIRLDLDEKGRAAGIPERVILKGGFEPHSRMMHYLHEQEVHAYADVAPASPLQVPACFFAAYDAEAQQGIVIMEDLVARGVTFLHPQRPQQPEDVAKRLVMLARHHAMSWGGTDFEPGGRFDWASHVADAVYFPTVLVPEIWQPYVESPRGAAVPTCFHDLAAVRRGYDRICRLSKAETPVLMHGDVHLGNLYIDVDGEPGFFDSLPQIGPPMQEVSFHVAGSLDAPVRRKHERDLVALYREELARCGIAPPSLEEFMRLYACHLLNGYVIFFTNASEFQPEAVNTAFTSRFAAAMLDHDTMALVETLPD